ncbi:alpha/beta fold hydrolase [Fodinibius halophilus]|uniref:Alpha/beta hydrolase n=1 Tax=Fodinibius halophilus TaxID=1736908 RepID=A0A6M1TC00_9BACT|nr:alpha/beta hydrolase [Fodinibius halophilus]NGP88454.1 alpha/beta hydrolase [Fodinibius halophilus]
MIKNKKARRRLENWYQKFLDKIDAPKKEQSLSTSFGDTHILIAGDTSKPPLLCLHAMMTSSAHLVAALEPLLENYHIIAPDIPGESVKGIPKRLSYSDDSQARWLNEILNGLALGKINLFGISLGGFIARQFASQHPQKVNNLILLVPAGIVQGSIFKGLMKMALPMIMYKIAPSEKRLRNLVQYLITNWDEDWAYYLGDAFNDFKTPSRIPPVAEKEELETLSMPCLVMAAEHDISFPGQPLINRVQTHIPHTETELIENSRHCPPTTDEFKNWLANRITTFLNNSS